MSRNTKQPDHPRPRARRRGRFAVTSALTLLFLTAACVFAVLIAERFNLRIDTTAHHDHSLAPRTRSVLESLDAPVQIVASANFQSLDPRITQRADDLLAAFADTSSHITVTKIDTGQPGAVPAYHQLVAEIAARESSDIQRATQSIDDALNLAQSVTDAIPALAQQCEAVAHASTESAATEWRSAVPILDQLAQELDAAIDQALPLRSTSLGQTTLPQPDVILQTLAPIVDRITSALAALESHARTLTPATPSPTTDPLTRAGDIASTILRSAATITDNLRRAPSLDALNVARLLREQEAILVLAPTKTAAVAFESIFPPPASPDADALLFAGEVPIANAIAAVTSGAQPTIILVHAEQEPILAESGEPNARFQGSIGTLARRLNLRQISLAEWPAALDTPMPTHASLDLDEHTPLVWFILGGPTASAQDGYNRIVKLAEATSRLIDNGQSILITINPSDLPAVGDANPLTIPLAEFGLDADSGRLLVSRTSTPRGPSFVAEHTITTANTTHAIGAALDALATYLPAATSINLTEPPPPNTQAWPLLSLPASDDTWAEARWQSPPPDPDPTRDDVRGPWHIAIAAQRTRPPTSPTSLPGNTQRIIAISASQWYVDRLTNARIQVEGPGGRTAAQFPGNQELLDASIAWLSGRDELIAQSLESQEVPRVKSLTSTQLTAIRWLLIAGLPALVLTTGAATKLLRRH